MPEQENLKRNDEYEGYVLARARCCMFEQADAERAVMEADLDFVEERRNKKDPALPIDKQSRI